MIEFDAALTTAATWLLLGAAAWGAAIVLAAAVESVTHGRVRALAGVGCPVAWRPSLLAALGVVLAATAPAQAATGGTPGPTDLPSSARLPVPTRPVDTGSPVDSPAGSPAGSPVGSPVGSPTSLARPTSTVLVAPGDSLWAIAAARLPPDATDAQVQALVGRLHRANRAVVGPDPDLLHPGQRLRVPTTPATPTTREDDLT